MSIHELHPLKPFLPRNTQLLILGSFPPPQHKWKMNFFYPNYQNDMWRIMGEIFYQDRSFFLNLAQKNFQLEHIKNFLIEYGIGIYDVALEVIRHQGNASDKHLEITQSIDLNSLLKKIPNCHTIMTTGDKATESLMTHFSTDTIKPTIQTSSHTQYLNRHFNLYRLPSSSRAYPLALDKKIKIYQDFFQKIGFI